MADKNNGDSIERVAYDLMVTIAQVDSATKVACNKDAKTALLNLYGDCIYTVRYGKIRKEGEGV